MLPGAVCTAKAAAGRLGASRSALANSMQASLFRERRDTVNMKRPQQEHELPAHLDSKICVFIMHPSSSCGSIWQCSTAVPVPAGRAVQV